MTRERILTVLSTVAVLTMMAFICWKLADQFKPANIYMRIRPAHTESSYEKLEGETMRYKILFRDNDRLIMELAGK